MYGVTRLESKLQHGRPLLGTALYRHDPVFVEIAALLGFQVLWIEMEHAAISFKEAADLCRIASGANLVTMIRIPDAARDNVLRAAECGPDILDLPMANTPDVLSRFVRHARYAPDGERGSFGASRAVRYGLYESMAEEQRRVNDELCLIGQIETREAVRNAEELCQVPGIDGVFFGPSDLSASFGVTGETAHPIVVESIARCIGIARKHGKLVALMASPKHAAEWAAKGVDLLFCCSDVAALRHGVRAIVDDFRASLTERASAL